MHAATPADPSKLVSFGDGFSAKHKKQKSSFINVRLFYHFRMRFRWPIAGHQNSRALGPCQPLPNVAKKHNFPKHTGTFGKSRFRKKNKKSVGLFNDFQWCCKMWLFLKNEKRFLKVRDSRRSARSAMA